MKGNTNGFFFPNLNGLRAIGAMIVMIGHVEFLKRFWKIPAYQWFPVPGKIGVALFFALSGFLITSLLINELQQTSTISLKKFYVRRILRIWPLYYFIVILSIGVFNQIGFLKMPVLSDGVYNNLSLTNILILLFLLPNITHYYIPYADQRWSIIVEEQFYLVQPFLVRILKNRQSLLIAFVLIILSPDLLYYFFNLSPVKSFISPNFSEAIITQFKYLACIAVGCLFSVLFFERHNITKKLLFTRLTQILVITTLITCVLLGHYVYFTEEVIDYRIYTFLFGIVVLNASQNPTTIFKLEYPIPDFLGKISYGIYMYHPVCIGGALALSKNINNLVLQNFLIYTVSIALTIIVSWLSFKYFESYFLKMKSKFGSIKTKRKKALGVAVTTAE